MPTASFSKSDLLDKAWELTKGHFWFLVSLSFVFIILSNLPGFISEGLDNEGVAITLAALTWIIQIFFGLGIINVSLKLIRGEPASWSDLWTPRHLFWRYLGGSIVYGLMVFVGLILLIVPGIIWGIKFQFFTYFLVDKELGVWEAFKESSRLTQGHKWNIFLYNLLLSLIALLGVILLIVGMFVAVPISWLATALVYQYLINNSQPTKFPSTQK